MRRLPDARPFFDWHSDWYGLCKLCDKMLCYDGEFPDPCTCPGDRRVDELVTYCVWQDVQSKHPALLLRMRLS